MTESQPPDLLTCPTCGKAGKSGQKFCNTCGIPLAAPAACLQCGAPMKSTARFCPNCGASPSPQPQQPAPATPHSALPQTSPASSPAKPAGSSKIPLLIGAVVIVAILAIGAFVVFSGNNSDSPVGALSGQSSSSTTKASQPVHGTITTGTVTQAAQGTIPASGGTITVNNPSSAINGLVFTAPSGAYPAGQQVTVSSAPITGTSFGSNLNPATPMISIDAGKEYAEETVTVKIPVSIPADRFAMAFYYDETNKKLEGIPTADRDSTSITIATRHFSNIFVSSISLPTLNSIKRADSGFRPGVDDWEFTNYGSELARGGHCAGQAVTAMWYYTEQRQKNNAPSLFGRFDNNGREKAQLFETDNTRGYRFASIIQAKMQHNGYFRNIGSIISNVSDYATLQEFKYSMLMTGEPQLVVIVSSDRLSAHAIICYEVSDNHLYVADPNYPGKERLITLNEKTNTFDPYSSGANALEIEQHGEKLYPDISYIAKSAMFSWPTIANQYENVESGRIGFSEWWPYKIKVYSIDATKAKTYIGEIELAGNNEKVHRFEVKEDRVFWEPMSRIREFVKWGYIVYKNDGSRIADDRTLTLKEGSNIYAIEIFEEGKWLGFDWIDIVYKPGETKAAATLQASRSLTKASIYAISNAGLSDPDCKMNNGYADSNCVPVTTEGAQGSILPYCGAPKEKCIDLGYNHGIESDYMYYTKTGGAGGTTLVPVLDGWWKHYNRDGTVNRKDKYKDGTQVGNCYATTSGMDCNGDTN